MLRSIAAFLVLAFAFAACDTPPTAPTLAPDDALEKPAHAQGNGHAYGHMDKPDHVTGGIWIEENSGYPAQVELSVHEMSEDGYDARGTMTWSLYEVDCEPWEYEYGGMCDLSGMEPDRMIRWDIEKANIWTDGDGVGHAYYWGTATYDSWGMLEGDGFYVHVLDAGTPATDGDMIWWAWTEMNDMESAPMLNQKDIMAGNLVVHDK